jgi:hypothetical protein
MAILPKVIYRVNAIPMSIQIPMTFFIKRVKNSVSEFILRHKRPQITKVILSKKSNAGSITILGLEIMLQNYSNKTSKIQKQTHRPIECNRRFRNKSKQALPSDS